MRLRSLLAASDLSARAELAVRRAASLAHALEARLDLLHVVEKNALDQLQELFGAEAPELAQRLARQQRGELEVLAGKLADATTLSAGVHVREGRVVEEIADFADAHDSSLVVVGAHGSDSTRQKLLGTTAERFLRRTRRPLLVVRGSTPGAYRRVLVALDFSERSHAALRYARALAPQVELSLLHVFELPFESKLRFAEVDESVLDQHRARTRQQASARLHEFARAAGLGAEQDYHCLVPHGRPAHRVVETAHQLGADLIVVCKHGLSLKDELLLGSVTRQVLAEASCDVLVVR